MNEKFNPTSTKVFHPPKIGEQISYRGKIYTLGKLIGAGNFASVYECYDEWDNELVAKIPLPQKGTYEQIRSEWIQELNKLSKLRHPNITYIYDAFEYRDTFYIIIERCASTLTDLINNPTIKGDIWIPHLAHDLLQALHFIHENDYVHKDIHPGNIFISWIKDRMVPLKDPVLTFKIGDLGITRLEKDIDVLNTLLAEWMLPPEFLNPVEFGTVNKQVDIYHIGLLLLSLLTKKIPSFNRDEIIQGKPRQIAEQISSPYAPIIAASLRRHTKDRIPSALDFWRAISRIKRR